VFAPPSVLYDVYFKKKVFYTTRACTYVAAHPTRAVPACRAAVA
jgi:hypothetical protein